MAQTKRSPSQPARLALVLLSCSLILIIVACGPQITATLTPTDLPPTLTSTTTLSPTQAPTQTPYIIIATAPGSTPVPTPQGLFFIALADGGRYHIFAYSPRSLNYTRLTTGDWDDTGPALSPDGTRLAFASNRNGYWNLYTLDLRSGALLQLTDTTEYKGDPCWSPDNAYLAYDSLVNGNMDIIIHPSTDPKAGSINLTSSPAWDYSPAWSPQGREIAFVSNRSGEPEVWIANLDNAGTFTDVSQDPQAVDSHPAWSPDATHLAWSANDERTGLSGIFSLDLSAAEAPASWVGSGDWPLWQDTGTIAAWLAAPNQSFLTAFTTSGTLTLPPIQLPGRMNGIAYATSDVPLPGPFLANAQVTPAPLFTSEAAPQPGSLPGRASLEELEGVTAPHNQLHEQAVASFQALRNRVAVLTGWDALGTLENAYVPLTTSLDPGLGEDWLYTGRAFTLNHALVDAGWMAVIQEDFGRQAYWHVYLRTTAQDGSMGAPLTGIPWDFSARTGSPSAYENGGTLMKSIPTGYWLDLTALAAQFGWQRLPALTNWRTYYAGVRYNEFAYTQGLDWRSAMLQIYPAEVLVTPTVVIPPTFTPTRTPMYWRSPTPTRTPTLRPTNTP